jgi:hypothetical protein
MSGWDLARSLRAGGHDAVPIIMISAHVGVLQAGPADAGSDPALYDDMLPKPLDISRLLDRLRHHLRLEWTEGDAPPAAKGPEGMPRPGPEDLAELLRLGRIGYVKGVESKLAEIANEPRHERFVSEARRHIRAFDFPSYLTLMEGKDVGVAVQEARTEA